MQIEELLNEGLKREYKIVVEASELDAKLDAVLDEFRATARIKGFRPGKAPLSLLKRMHGERAKGQVLNDAMQESSTKLFEEKNIRPALRPEVDMGDYEDGKNLEYTLKVEVLPEIDGKHAAGLVVGVDRIGVLLLERVGLLRPERIATRISYWSTLDSSFFRASTNWPSL